MASSTPKNLDQRLFDDSGRHLDRFGWLLVLSIATVTLSSLIDIDNPTENLKSEVGWVTVTVISGVTLILALRSSGMVRKYRRIAEIAIWIVIAVIVIISVFEITVGGIGVGISGARPSGFWVVIAFLSPIVVLRRVAVHERVTRATIFGAVSVYLLLAIAFNYAFMSVGSLIDGHFFNQGAMPTTSFMYYSLTTITTLGYGDLSAATEVGRFLSTAEALIGQVFLVTVVARLISIMGTEHPASSRAARSSTQEP